jgi:hypothetical protein
MLKPRQIAFGDLLGRGRPKRFCRRKSGVHPR